MSAFILPKWVILRIDRLRRAFLWKGSASVAGGHCLLNWKRVCLPFSNGGLGILDLESFNLALICRWWAFYWDDSIRPWKSLCNHLPLSSLFPKAPLLDNIFLASSSFSLGDGRRCSFWHHRWLDNRSLAVDFPCLYSFASSTDLSVSEALRDHLWLLSLHLPLSPLADTQRLALSAILPPHSQLARGAADTARWKWTADGMFSSRSTYRALCLGRTSFALETPLWKAPAPLRCKFFMWLALSGGCLTADRLQRRGWPYPALCTLCSASHEDASHLFLFCPFTLGLFGRCAAALLLQLPPPSPSSSLIDRWLFFRRSSDAPRSAALDALFICFSWHIWLERNRRIFEKKALTVFGLWDFLLKDFKSWPIRASATTKSAIEAVCLALGA